MKMLSFFQKENACSYAEQAFLYVLVGINFFPN